MMPNYFKLIPEWLFEVIYGNTAPESRNRVVLAHMEDIVTAFPRPISRRRARVSTAITLAAPRGYVATS
jgi:hypothetical protein